MAENVVNNRRMTSEQLAQIKERASKATAGPWCKFFGEGIGIESEVKSGVAGEVVSQGGVTKYPDAEFIAHAREDVPALITEVERLRLALEDVADTGEHYHEHWCRDIAKEALK
jgi:hypothetical protein